MLGNVLLLGSLALVVYGAWREGSRMLRSCAALLQQWCALRRVLSRMLEEPSKSIMGLVRRLAPFSFFLVVKYREGGRMLSSHAALLQRWRGIRPRINAFLGSDEYKVWNGA